jgi:deoxyribonuclease-4
VRVGAHISITGGVEKAVDRALEVGCEAVQIFSGNPRGWKVKVLAPDEGSRFRALCAEHSLRPVIVHTPYLINLASPDEEIFRKSLDLFETDLGRARSLGAEMFVTHVGYHRGNGFPAGIERMAGALGEALRRVGDTGVKVLLENTASAGSSLGHRFEFIAEIMDRSGVSERLHLCLDTCHAFVSGYDVSTAAGLDRTLEEIDRFFGLDRLLLVHFNDSKYGFDSHSDRHEHIGEGKIGLDGMRRIARHEALREKTFIIETPKQTPEDDPRNLALLKSFRDAPST